jgi:hypothetical protein
MINVCQMGICYHERKCISSIVEAHIPCFKAAAENM